MGLDAVITIIFTDKIVTGTAFYTAIEAYSAFRVLEQSFYSVL